MLGSLLSTVTKVVTLPLDVDNSTMDVMSGGSGSKASRTNPNDLNPLGDLERIRDRVAETLEEIDE